MTYGSEAWTIDEQTRRALNGANASMVSVMTDKSPHQEASVKSQTFDLVDWVRARRLQWLGHILRMGTDRMLKRAVFEMFKARKPGDMLMDPPEHDSWRALCTAAMDKEKWRARVRVLRQPRVTVDMSGHLESEMTFKCNW